MGYSSPKKGLVIAVGFFLIGLLFIFTLARYHVQTEHKLKIASLEQIRLALVYAHLEKEDSTLTILQAKHLFLTNTETYLNKLLEKRWDDRLIPLITKVERLEIINILKQVAQFKTLLNGEKVPELKAAHDVIFNAIIKNINDLHIRLKKKVTHQNNVFYISQVILIIIAIAWLVFTIITLRYVKADRKSMQSFQEDLLKKLKRNNYFLEKAQDISNLGYYTFNLSTREWTASDFILDLVGYKKGDNILDDWKKIVHPDDGDVLPKIFYDNTVTGDFYFDLTYRIIRKQDGKTRWIHHVASKLEGVDNQSDITVIGVVQDITDKYNLEFTIKSIEKSIALKIGEDYFITLAKALNKILKADYILIGKYDEEKTASTSLAYLNKQKVLPNLTYNLANTPCENVFTCGYCLYPKGVSDVFSDDAYLKEKGIEAYVGRVIYNKDKQPVGHLVAMFCHPIDKEYPFKTLIQFFADKIGVEFDRNKLLEELYKSQEKLVRSQRLALLGTYEYDLKTNSINDKSHILCEIAGLKPKTLKTLDDWRSVIHPNDINAVKDIFRHVVKSSRNFELDYRIITQDTKQIKWIRSMGQVIQEEGVSTHILGSMQDITQQKTTELSLEQSTVKFKNLFQKNPIALWEEDYSKVIQLLDKKKREVSDLKTYLDENSNFVLECLSSGIILNVNKTVLDLFEVADKKEFGQHLKAHFNEEHLKLYKKGLLAIALNKRSLESEIDFVTKTGKTINTILKVVMVGDKGKALFTINNITERKLAEQALIESHEKLKEAQNITGLGTFTYYDSTKTFETSTLLNNIAGIDRSFKRDVEGWKTLAHPDDYGQMKHFFDESELVNISHEFRVIRPKNKKNIWVLAHFKKVFDNKGNRKKITGTIQDITQRKEAEEKLIQSDDILNRLDSLVLVSNGVGNIVYVSPSTKKILGYEPEELLGQGWWQLTFTDKKSHNKIKDIIKDYYQDKGSMQAMTNLRKIKTRDGAYRYIEWHVSKGEGDTVIAIGIDITDSKDKDLRFKKLTETANSAIILANEKGLVIEWNEAAFRIFGYTKEEILGKPLKVIIPDKYKSQHTTAFVKANKRGDIINNSFIELEGLTKKGILFPIEMALNSWKSKGENIYCAFINDISIRQREGAVKKVIFDINKYAHSNPKIEDLLPFVKDSLSTLIDTSNFYVALYNSVKHTFKLEFIEGEDADLQGESFPLGKSLTAYVLRKKKTTVLRHTEFEDLDKSGEAKLLGKPSKIWVGVPLIEANKAIGVMTVQSYTDTDAFKKEDIALLEHIATHISQVIKQAQDYEKIQLLNQSMIQSPAAIVITDRAGCIEYVNPTFSKLSGYSYKEAIGQNPRILKSGDQEDAYYKNLWDTITMGKIWRGEFVNKSLDNRKYLVSATISPVKDVTGEITHFIGVQEDITEKRQLERDYLNAFVEAQEEEKEHFGEELHDGISQILAAESMYIEILIKQNKDRLDDKAQYLLKVRELNHSAISDARRIAHGLMSKQLKQNGLLKAIAHICDDFSKSKRVQFKFTCKNIVEAEIVKEIKTNLFRVSQEISTNILRHSGATQAAISINKTPKNELILIVEDNGVGIDFEKVKRENRGAGLKNIERRITLLKGKVDTESVLNKGTRYTITVPLLSPI